MNIVLLEPEIPLNTGNIGRTCVATGATLHLIKPLGFSILSKDIKRAGLDYWVELNFFVYENLEEFLLKNNNPKIFMASTKGQNIYTEVKYNENSYIMFGKESAGIPEEILVKNQENCIRIPMFSKIRSLNLANAVSVVLYESLRQTNFSNLNTQGELTKFSW